MIRKNTKLLWALTDNGIVIQHLGTNLFYELGVVEERIWSYVDGTHSEEDILNKIVDEFNSIPRSELFNRFENTMTLLKGENLISD